MHIREGGAREPENPCGDKRAGWEGKGVPCKEQGLLQRKRGEVPGARKSGCAYGRGGTLCREQR